MGPTAIRLLRFAIRFNGWIPYGKDRKTVDALRRLSDLGFIERNMRNRQFRLIKPDVQPI